MPVERGSGGGHRASRRKGLGAMVSGLSWWQVVLVVLPFALAGVGGALGGALGGAAAWVNAALARRKRHGAVLTALSMICVDALACGAYFGVVAVILSKPATSPVARPAVTPTPRWTQNIQPPGPDFTPNTGPVASQPPGVTLNAPTVLHSTGAALSWPAYVNTSGAAAYDITAYQVYRGTGPEFIAPQAALVASLAPGRTSFVDATTRDPYGGPYSYMVAVRTRSGAVINGTPLRVQLPLAGQTTVFIPAVASDTLSAAYPNTVADALVHNGPQQPEVEVGSLGGLGATRGVFGFGALNTALPSGAVVVEAHLRLWDNATNMLGPTADYGLYGLSRAFTASRVTWNSSAPGIPWTKPGGDYTTTPAGSGLAADETDPWFCEFDATAIVRGWISDPGSEYGLLLRANDEKDPHHTAWFPAMSDRVVPQTQRPLLVITYTG